MPKDLLSVGYIWKMNPLGALRMKVFFMHSFLLSFPKNEL